MVGRPAGSSVDETVGTYFQPSRRPIVTIANPNNAAMFDGHIRRLQSSVSILPAAAHADPVAMFAEHTRRSPEPDVLILPAAANVDPAGTQVAEHFQRSHRPKAPRQENDDSFRPGQPYEWQGGNPPFV